MTPTDIITTKSGLTATLYLADCLEVLPTLGRVDAVITDPPYGVGFGYESHDDNPTTYAELRHKWYGAMRAVAQTVAVSCGVANIHDWPKADWVLAWHKPAAMGRCKVGYNNWEPILLYGKSQGRNGADVLRAPIVPSKEKDGHPCPKPDRWAEAAIERLAKDAEFVADPFMGSGTTGVAALRMGCNFIGIEISDKYYAIAKRRIAAEAAQGRLFT